jgi:hypothetical protein
LVESLASIPLLSAALPAWAALAMKKKRGSGLPQGSRSHAFYQRRRHLHGAYSSLMPEEVLDAMRYASSHYVHLTKRQDAVGARIASMTGAEAAMVTSGAAGALLVGTAACITARIRRRYAGFPLSRA